MHLLLVRASTRWQAVGRGTPENRGQRHKGFEPRQTRAATAFGCEQSRSPGKAGSGSLDPGTALRLAGLGYRGTSKKTTYIVLVRNRSPTPWKGETAPEHMDDPGESSKHRRTLVSLEHAANAARISRMQRGGRATSCSSCIAAVGEVGG